MFHPILLGEVKRKPVGFCALATDLQSVRVVNELRSSFPPPPDARDPYQIFPDMASLEAYYQECGILLVDVVLFVDGVDVRIEGCCSFTKFFRKVIPRLTPYRDMFRWVVVINEKLSAERLRTVAYQAHAVYDTYFMQNVASGHYPWGLPKSPKEHRPRPHRLRSERASFAC